MNGLINVLGERCSRFVNDFVTHVFTAIKDNADDAVCRMSCGLVSDLAHNVERHIVPHLNEIMTCLLQVLRENNYNTEIKLAAIIAVGDVCLASDNDFASYVDATMDCLFTAGQMAMTPLEGLEEENKQLLVSLRKSILEAFVAIVHGI